MKIRLMGTADLVRAWAKMLENAYGLHANEYPCRGSGEIRVYLDLDDRLAAEIANLSATRPPGATAGSTTGGALVTTAPARKRIKRTSTS